MRWFNPTFELKVKLSLGVGALVILVAGVVGFQAIEDLLAVGRLEARTQYAHVQIERLTTALRSAEAAQRRFLLTGREQDLTAYQESRTVLGGELASAADVITLPQQRARLRVYERVLDERLAAMDRIVAARAVQGVEAASRLVTDDEAQERARRVEEATQQLRQGETLELVDGATRAVDEARLAKALVAGGTLLSICLLIWGAAVIQRHQEERDEADRRLRESEARGRAIMRNMAEGVITTEIDGTIIEANHAAQELFGYGPGELLGRNVVELVPERSREEFRAVLGWIASQPAGVRQQGQEIRALRKDGTRFYVNAAISDIQVDGRRLLTGLMSDVSERRRIMDALHASETQLREVADNVPALIAYVDAERCFRFHNKPYEDFFGLTAEQIDHRSMLQVLGPEVYAILEPRVDEVLAGRPVRYTRQQTNAAGDLRDLAGHFFPKYGEGANEGRVVGFYSLVTDITEIRKVDRMKSEFISTVSHELRTPLTSIRGSLGLLSGGVAGKLPDQAAQLIDIAKNNCERLIRLINDILDIEKIESGKMRFELRDTPLAPLIAQAVVANEGFAAHHAVRLRFEARAAPVARVDADRLTQVVTNLVSNAVKFSPQGSEVVVALVERDGRARVEVRDRGPGIAADFRGRIFEKFSQADASDTKAKGGTGLGLNISRAIVEQFGGRIGFETEEGVGTTFHFELPVVVVPAVAFRIDRAAAGPPVLVCEDDADIAKLITMMLERAGFACDVARDAAQARERLAARAYAAMTLDVKLPGEDGISLLHALRGDQRTAQLPVVIVSASAQGDGVHLGREILPVSEWLQKPIEEVRLVEAVRSAIAGGPSGCPRILHVEDDPDIRHIAAAIAPECATVEFAATLGVARHRLATRSFDLVILDLQLPDGPGETLAVDISRLRPRPATLVFSAMEPSELVTARFDAALVKSVTSNEELAATISRLLRRPAARTGTEG